MNQTFPVRTAEELIELDGLTPAYKTLIEAGLSVQERRVLVAIVRATRGQPTTITATEVRDVARILQTNQVHAILGRMVTKGFLAKEGRSLYGIKDERLSRWLWFRSRGRAA